MTYFVFAGPTISAAEIAAVVDAIVLPPVSMGDVYRYGRTGPSAIGIIDGYFDGVPSVWHKEVLWAIEQGIAVFGASSMGALRAAELHSFGMRGVGRIFEAFRDGLLEDDDEVAIEHGPAEMGFLPLSEPMVNIRATLDRAVKEDAIALDISVALLAVAKESFYPERRWRALIERAAGSGLDKEALKAFEAWLPKGRIDQKRLDAVAMLEAMEAFRLEGPQRRVVDYRLERTTMWSDAVRDIEASEILSRDASAIIEELRHDPQRLQAVRRSAAARFMAGRAGPTAQASVGARTALQTTTRFRTERRLFTQSAFDQWLTENDLDKGGFEQMMLGEAQLAELEAGSDLTRQMLDELRLSDTYGELAARARRKRDLLQSLGMPDAIPLHTGLTVLELRRWFFETRLGRRMQPDVSSFLDEAGYPDKETFDGAIAREYIYLSRMAADDEPSKE